MGGAATRQSFPKNSVLHVNDSRKIRPSMHGAEVSDIPLDGLKRTQHHDDQKSLRSGNAVLLTPAARADVGAGATQVIYLWTKIKYCISWIT